MYFLDVNVLLYAYRPSQSAEAARARTWLDTHIAGPRPLAVSREVLASVVRIATNPRAFDEPASPAHALSFVDAVLGSPAVSVMTSGPRHWEIFRNQVSSLRLRGNDIPDAFLAAHALEYGATLVTSDRGFGRFAGLKLLDPLAAKAEQ